MFSLASPRLCLAIRSLAIAGCLVGLFVVAREILLFLQPNAFVLDAQLYWGVGRGMLNGLTPYRDLFEIKPPGVFVLSALSWGLIGSGYLGNLLGALTIVMVPATLSAYAWHRARAEDRNTRMELMLLALLAGCYWSIFMGEKGQPWQTEVFGSFFALLYVATLFFPFKNKWLPVGLATLGLLGSIGFKEPFLFACAGGAIIAAQRPKDLLRSFLIPLILAAAIGALLMLLFGWLQPYLHFYLPTLNYRGYGFGPLWLRGFSFIKVGINLAHASLLAPIAVLGLIGAICIQRFTGSITTSWKKILALFLGIYLGMLAVGAAGDYQAHHFVFLTPVFLALVFAVLRDGSRWIAALLVLWSFTLIVGIKTPGFVPHDATTLGHEEAVAAGIDDVLDRCAIGRYFLVKKDGLMPFGFTEHSPLNHSLFLQIDMAVQYGQEFLDISLKRLSDAQVIVFPKEEFVTNNVVGNAMGAYIARTFSEVAPDCAKPLPELPGYGKLFRAKDEPFTDTFKFDGPSL